MACIEVFDVPSAASNDDIGVLVSQFAPVVRILLLSAGPGGEGRGLVWLPPGSDLAAVAEALDCHPVAGGLIYTKLCDDPMRWVVNNIGTEQLIPVHGQPMSQPAPAYAPSARLPSASGAPAAAAGAAAVIGAAGAAPTAGRLTSSDSSGNGVSAMEAELRELQSQLQEQALAGGLQYEYSEEKGHSGEPEGDGAAGSGWNWGGSQGSSEDSGWQQAERRGGGGRRATGGGGGGGGVSGSHAACSRLVVHNVLPQLTHNQMFEFFREFGWIEELAKPKRDAQYVFVHYADADAAAAVKRALHGRVVPILNPGNEVTVEYRDPRVAPAMRQPGVRGRETGSDVPTTKVWVGHVVGTASIQTLTRIFGKYGDVYALELRRAPEAGRQDQWGFVNFRRLEDAQAAYDALRFRQIPELSGDKPLKLQYRPV